MKDLFLNQETMLSVGQDIELNVDQNQNGADGWKVIRVADPETVATAQSQRDRKKARKENERTEYAIYSRSIKEWLPVDKEYYLTYRREIHAFRKRHVERDLCRCPYNKEYMCDCDCLTCPFYIADQNVSLDAPIFDDEGNETTLMDTLVDPTAQTPEDVAMEKAEYEALYRAIERLKPSQQTVIRMMLADKTQVEIAIEMGLTDRSTVASHKKKAIESLRRLLNGTME